MTLLSTLTCSASPRHVDLDDMFRSSLVVEERFRQRISDLKALDGVERLPVAPRVDLELKGVEIRDFGPF
eukprot:3372810-Prorocentrum_lima.AAC.1